MGDDVMITVGEGQGGLVTDYGATWGRRLHAGQASNDEVTWLSVDS